MHARTKYIIKAQRYWREEFEGWCIFKEPDGSRCHRTPVEGCHIYPKKPYPHLSSALQNGVSSCRHHHRIFDSQGKPPKKILWLKENVHREFETRILNKLDLLDNIVQAYIEANARA